MKCAGEVGYSHSRAWGLPYTLFYGHLGPISIALIGERFRAIKFETVRSRPAGLLAGGRLAQLSPKTIAGMLLGAVGLCARLRLTVSNGEPAHELYGH